MVYIDRTKRQAFGGWLPVVVCGSVSFQSEHLRGETEFTEGKKPSEEAEQPQNSLGTEQSRLQ